ncbi:TetR family transcriptional regulator [Bacillus sp. ISL-51]|uniref:TetR/AcrR family transcriptional regulator n=1 Tax=unclassified Bacillus (in: firmicutes) TaxID=185979 RepID=UPI001BE88B02|nr:MULTISPECIES: TetR family transcriptional regulator [unclassified Bacillus (in: firmicutes)]MBT2574280.1 TetR family transcriptional regulator [Bacillus sp. ISL-51]MBT2633097.1 TetR family transcriptional regulator [Bacillus sp. ISL-26]
MNEKVNKREILDAAEHTLRRFGPKKTSVTDIAKALNVSHGTIYRYYPSKTALKEAVTERWLKEQISAPLQSLLTDSENESPDMLLKAYVLKLISLKQTYAKQVPEMFDMYAEVTARSAGLISRHIKTIIGQIRSIIQKGMENDTFQSIADDLACSVFYATARFHHPAHAYEWNGETIREDFEQVWKLISEGFLKKGGKEHD